MPNTQLTDPPSLETFVDRQLLGPEPAIPDASRACPSVCDAGRPPSRFPADRNQFGSAVIVRRGPAMLAKRGFDILASSAALLALAPVFAAVALGIKLSSKGPVLFRQNRYGQHNDLFQIYKFRTMYGSAQDTSGIAQTQSNDPRVTPIGKFLRKTNIDELPQLLNVVIGQMSLIGPRPHVPGMLAGGVKYETLIPYYFARHALRPGITGLAQVNELRGPTEDARFAKARIDYDLAYIEHWSPLLDLRILFTTIKTECFGGTGS